MQDIIMNYVVMTTLIIIAACQIKQAFFPVIYPYESEESGVEIPKDIYNIDEDDPLYRAVIESYERAKTFKYPGAFVEQIIDDSMEPGVEIITEKDEQEV